MPTLNNVIPFPAHRVAPAASAAQQSGSAVKPFPVVRDLTLADLAARAAYVRALEQPTPNADGVHVGDLFYCSWGYDMTIINFFQVVELRGQHTAIIRRIDGELASGDNMEGRVRPCRGHFSGEAIRARTRCDPYRPDAAQVFNRDRDSWMSATTDDRAHAFNHLD